MLRWDTFNITQKGLMRKLIQLAKEQVQSQAAFLRRGDKAEGQNNLKRQCRQIDGGLQAKESSREWNPSFQSH